MSAKDGASKIIDPVTCQPSETNARLIAAAPELLEALKIAVRQNSHDTGEKP